MMNHPTRIQKLALTTLAIAAAAQAQQFAPVSGHGDHELIGIINGSKDGAPPVLPFAQGMRWNNGDPDGTPLSLTWSLAPDGAALTDSNGVARGSSILFATLDNQFGEGVIDPADPRFQFGGRQGDSGANNNMGGWQEVFEGAFESWSLRSGLNFTQQIRLLEDQDPPTPDPDDRDDDIFYNFWDDGSAWFTEGPITDPGSGNEVGDIRIAMAPLDGSGGIFFDATGTNAQTTDAMAGHIILDSAENWTLITNAEFQFLFNQVARSVGICVGLLEACPDDGRLLMRRSPIEGNNRTGPQFEDVRAVQRLYGDNGETNDTMGGARLIGVTANDQDNNMVILSNLPSATSPQNLGPLSIDRNGDVDFYFFTVTEVDVQYNFSLIPDGSVSATINDVARDPVNGCDPADDMIVAVNALQNLSITIFDNTGAELITINSGAAGEEEVFELLSTPDDFGTWFIRVQGDTNDLVQRYILVANASVGMPGITDEFQLFLNDEARLNIGMWTEMDLRSDGGNTPLDFAAMNPPLQRAVIGIVDTLQPNLGHATLSDQQPAVAAWPGVGPGDPDRAVSNVMGQHATAVAGAALGEAFFMPRGGTLEDIDFVGISSESILATGAPATTITQGGTGAIGLEALYFALFGLTDPLIATGQFGLPAPATIINSSFGGITSDFPGVTGDGDLALAFDALVWMRDVTVVLPAGDSGGLDRTATCNFDGDPMQPGGPFVGARTINNPATCFNAIVVGGVSTQFDTGGDIVMGDDNMDNFQDDILRVPSFSAKGPIDSYDYRNQMVVSDTRSGVHLLAPAAGAVGETPFQNACPYPGKRLREQLSVPSFDPTMPVIGQENEFAALVGTSFSAPMVAGAVALMEDLTTFLGDAPYSPLIYKACLMNSAQKMEGWTNNGDPGMPQDARDGRMEMGTTGTQLDLWDPETMQPLDHAQGAGWLDMQVLFLQFAGTNNNTITRDLPQTPPRRSIVTRVFVPPIPNPFPAIGPVIGELDGQADPDFPTLAERGDSPVEIRTRLAMARDAAKEETMVRPLADIGDFPIGGGGTGVNPTVVTRPVTGPIQNVTLPIIEGNPIQRTGQLPLAFNPIVVENTGWDLAQVGVRTVPGMGRMGFVDYVLPDVQPGQVITATLVWNRRVEVREPNFNNLSNPRVGEVTGIELEDLDLTLFVSNEFGDAASMVAQSNSGLSNVEHLTFQAPAGGDPAGDSYLLRVEWIATDYDLFVNGVQGDVQYCLAWRTSELGGTIFNPIVTPAVAGDAPQFSFNDLVKLVMGYGSRVYTDNYSLEADVNTDGKVDMQDLTRMLNNM